MLDTKIIPHFGVGDIVRFEFTHVHEEAQRHVVGRVLSIAERYNKRPLIRYQLLEGEVMAIERDQDQYADAGYITEVVERFSGPRPPRGNFVHSGPIYVQKTRSEMIGWPYEMVYDVLEGKYLDIPRPLSLETIWWMFHRDRPGVIGEVHPGLYRVRRKSFERWVMRNYRRFIMTVAQCRAEAEAEDEAYQAAYEADFYRELERDLPSGPREEDRPLEEDWDDPIGSW